MSAPATAVAVRYERSGAIGRIVLDQPPLNILTREALEDLEAAISAAAGDRHLTVLCLQGNGRAFCAGVSVADHAAERVSETLAVFGRCLRLLLSFEAPVIGAVHGATLGGGCELALACDFVVARADLKLGLPEITLGVLPPAGAALLPRLAGCQTAMDLVLTGRSLGAEEALRLGLVRSVFATDDFGAGCDALLARLAALSAPVLRVAKRAVREGCEGLTEGALARTEALYRYDLLRLPDAHEGIAAFLEKRPPHWRES